MKAILVSKEVKNTHLFVAVIQARDWYEPSQRNRSPIMEDDFVVCTYYDFHDGFKSNIEGKTTIAICRDFDDAKTLLDSNFVKLINKYYREKHR